MANTVDGGHDGRSGRSVHHVHRDIDLVDLAGRVGDGIGGVCTR